MSSGAIGFLVSMTGILLISRKSMPVGLISGAVILGLFTLPPAEILNQFIYTISDGSILQLALAMAAIPVIGGVMKANGQIDDLIENLRINRRALLAISPALMGLLPMPGGALLSSPLLDKAGRGVDTGLVASINIWYRHLLILLYPLSPALIISAQISGLDVYQAVIWLLPILVLALILGYAFFLRHVNGDIEHSRQFSWTGLATPLAVVMSAPVIDFVGKRVFSLGTSATLTGVLVALCLSVLLSRKRAGLWKTAAKAKPWNFGVIIIGMLFYLHVFQQTDVGELILLIPLPPLVLCVTAGFLLGFFTGRIQLPASITLPVYLAIVDPIPPVMFALVYTGIFFGYVLSPVHPCLVVTCEYFGISVRRLMSSLAAPTLIVFGTVLLLALLVQQF